ncbi:MAG TPA: bestrophin family ion channel [Hymenobacter sp.]|jgi:putative membrane protein|uniref:bestrophin family protein n=1 Tax=Hymenobacter sp. TaxID=1898978 RepID=UPI002ED7E0FA
MLINKTIPFGYVFRSIRSDLVRVLLISVFFQLMQHFYLRFLPAIPLQLATLLGSAISLLLAFILSQSYDRWWEARKVWGAIVNDSRTLVLQVQGFVPNAVLRPGEADSPLRAVAYRQIAWCYALGRSLRGQEVESALEPFLSAQELAAVRHHTNKPLALVGLHTDQIKTLYEEQALDGWARAQLDATLVRLVDSMGKAERIKSTVFPVAYRQLVHFFVYLFVVVLSLSLVETIGWWEPPVLLVIAGSFLLLERTAGHLQDPFSNQPTDTPVTAIARTIEINLKQLVAEGTVPAPAQAESYYLM